MRQGHSYALINLVQIYKLHIVKTRALLFALYFFFLLKEINQAVISDLSLKQL